MSQPLPQLDEEDGPATEDPVEPDHTPQRKLTRPKRLRAKRRELTIEQILQWADGFHATHKRWPTALSGPVAQTLVETWRAIDKALRQGGRGLPTGSSLARLLAERRGHRNIQALPPLTEELILQWADGHFQRTGRWPDCKDDAVEGEPGECWRSINTALRLGGRGLPGGSSLAKLLAARRGRRNRKGLPALTVEQVLAWADVFHECEGRYPTDKDGAVPGTGGETWSAIDAAMHNGCRGFLAGTSLPQVLAEHRGVRNRKALPPLTVEQILAWAQAFHQANGRWPGEESGPVEGAAGEVWYNVNAALSLGFRGLPGGSSLYRLLLEAGVRERLPGH